MRILGISAQYHDSAASLLADGRIVAAVQEERFTRKKQDSSFPKKSIEWVLKTENLKLSDLDAIVYYEKPLFKFDRILETYIHNAPFGLKNFIESAPIWLKQKLFLRQDLTRELKRLDPQLDPTKILFSEHHLSHAASAFYPSPFEEALVLTLDGVGEWATSSVAVGKGYTLKIHKEGHFPDSLGFLYSALTTFCGFKVNSGEYKLMGLAPYGQPRFFAQMLEHLVSLNDDGSFSLNLKYFDFLSGQKMFHQNMAELLGVAPRSPESQLSQEYMDIAASAQKLLEHILLKMIRALHKEFPFTNLCLAGGVALNCVANSEILKMGLFKNIWVQPAAGDAGGSLGAALAANYLHFKEPRKISPTDSMAGSYLGPRFSDGEIEAALKMSKLQYTKLEGAALYKNMAQQLSQGLSVGWFQGAMEFGPRALGARSILADPRPQEMQKKLNLQIKFRESFRPFAPLVLEEDVSTFFEWDRPSPYMLFTAAVKKDLQAPAVTHVDGSARLQTVNAEQNPCIYPLLKEFKQQTGCSVLVNTSFNVRGEPIVCSPEDAVRCFLGTDLDVLALGSFVVEKSQQPQLEKVQRYYDQFALD